MSKTNEMTSQKENNLAQMKSGDVLDLMIRNGTIPDPRITDEKIQQAKQEKAKHVYHNTLLLLTKYRDIVWSLKACIVEISDELQTPFNEIDKLLTQVDIQLSLNNSRLEHKLDRIAKSRILLDRVHTALSVLKQKPGNGERLYEVLYHTYISDDVLTHPELLDKFQISDRQYYRLRQNALDIVSLQLWSADGMLGLWIEVLEILTF